MTKTKTTETKKETPKGGLMTRGRKFRGKVTSTKMDKTVTVKLTTIRKIPKYERYAKKSTKIKAHLPEHIKVKTGEIVQIEECRPISKTKSFVVTEVI